jgi:uncharacterized protein (TIGR02646 family)
MRFIKKDANYKLRTQCKEWGNLRKKQREPLIKKLRDEQYSLCAYSEIAIPHNNSELGAHIEQVQPKGKYPKRTFDYCNLVLNALHSDYLPKKDSSKNIVAQDEIFGGHAKGEYYDSKLFISCLDSNCANYFTYLSDGRVVSAKDSSPAKEKAEYTIKLLNLNSSYLINKRRDWLDDLDKSITKYTANNTLESLIASYLIPKTINSLKELDPFFSASRQRFDKLANKILKKEAPELL